MTQLYFQVYVLCFLQLDCKFLEGFSTVSYTQQVLHKYLKIDLLKKHPYMMTSWKFKGKKKKLCEKQSALVIVLFPCFCQPA